MALLPATSLSGLVAQRAAATALLLLPLWLLLEEGAVGYGLAAAVAAAVYLATGGHYTCYLLWHTFGRDMR